MSEQQYLDLLYDVYTNGVRKEDRTGTGTLSVFGRQLRFDLQEGFPAITTKRLFWKGVVAELIWFLKGSTNIRWLQKQGVHIWDKWADEKGELGPIYGKQWRKWQGEFGWHDQIANVIESIKTNPDSRRHIVTAWNLNDIPHMALPPCHVMFQFYVDPGTCNRCDGEGTLQYIRLNQVNNDICHSCSGTGKRFEKPRLSCQLYQRSADLFLGVPFNIASYALLTHMIAQVCNLDVGEFVHTFGDAHIYINHMKQVQTQLSRKPFLPPKLKLTSHKNINSFKLHDCSLDSYLAHSAIKGEVAV